MEWSGDWGFSGLVWFGDRLGDEGVLVVYLSEVGGVLRILGGERGGEEGREKREADPSGT